MDATLEALEQELIAARAAFADFEDPDSAEADEAWSRMHDAEVAWKSALANRPATKYETWMD